MSLLYLVVVTITCSREYKVRVSVDGYFLRIFSRIQVFGAKIIDGFFPFNNSVGFSLIPKAQ